MSLPTGDLGNSGRLCEGTLQDLLINASGAVECRKGLGPVNCRDYNAGIEPSPLASDERAIRRTRDDVGCIRAIPPSDVRFRQASTCGAMTPIMANPNGDACYTTVDGGQVLWVVIAPNDSALLHSTTSWRAKYAELGGLDFAQCKVAMVLLHPGDTM
jgi:hypothetical protein